jgi:hypothetical protein
MGREFGGVGAAFVWLALNLGYVAIGIPLMHRRLLPTEMSRWYWVDVLPPLAASTGVGLAWRIAVPGVPNGPTGWVLLLVVLLTTIAASLVVSSFPRSMLGTWYKNLRVSK